MPSSPATESIPLLRPWAFGLSCAVVALVLALSYQHKDAFLPNGKKPDAVSVSYAELLLAADPGNDELRAQLVEMLINLGRFYDALTHLKAWEGGDPLTKRYYNLLLDGNVAIVRQDKADMALARQQLEALDYSALGIKQQRALATLALELGEPLIAARLFDSLAQRLPAERKPMLMRAARWSMAGNAPAEAALVYQSLVKQVQTPKEKLFFIRKAHDAWLAAGQPGQAASYTLQALREYPDVEPSDSWLQQAVGYAVGAMRYDLAEQLVAYWLAREPDNLAALRADFNLQLSRGDTAGAWESGQTLLAYEPATGPMLKQMALLAQWHGEPEAALHYWSSYLAQEDDPAVRETAWRLALQLFDYDQGIELLAGTAATRRLTDEELELLIYAQESRGTPELAERWLRDYLRDAGQQRLAWVKLLQVLEHTLQPQAAVQTWDNFARGHRLSVAERVSWAEVLWDTYQPERAWQVLDIGIPDELNPDYWRLRAALAWELERDAELASIYQTMQQKGVQLTQSEEGQLIELYRQSDPQRAMALAYASWQRSGDARRLIDAIQLAEYLQEWDQLAAMVGEAEEAGMGAQLPVLLARGLLAERSGETDKAERIYLQALADNPTDLVLRERLLWLYVDGRNLKQLQRFVAPWERSAAGVPSLWLALGAANQMLERNERALRWYQRYTVARPDDLLGLAAYADALDGADRTAAAQRLRAHVIKHPQFAAVAATPQGYQTWLRLMMSARSHLQAKNRALAWQDGSASMLQLWFEALLDHLDITNQEAQKDAWLAWGRAHNLRIDNYDQVQEALRTYNRDTLGDLLLEDRIDPAQRVETLARLGGESRALGDALSELGDEQPLAVRQQLWRQALEMTEQHPQGVQVGWAQDDFGGLELEGPRLSAARYLGDNWYWRLDAQQARYHASQLDTGAMGAETTAALRVERNFANGYLALTLDGSQRQDDDRNGFGIARQWLLGRDQVVAGLDWQRESRETGLMRAVGQQDAVWLNVSQSFSARDQLNWALEHRQYESRSGLSIGAGEFASVEFSQVQFFSGPTWILRSGLEVQNNRLDSTNLSSLLSSNGGVVNQGDLTTEELLPERVGRFYVGSQLRRGFPGALNRTRGQYTWLLDTAAGWDWVEQGMTYSVNAGVGIEVLGDDELSFTTGYQSAPLGGDGESGGNVNISYSSRFGR
ncbi:Tetratricopeptide repeat-containing protein [Halopseudomonas sabulinigri]|uniref:Tetratricopeptide repeat-containing protein n=1 Tax=Halopseudomonas sabulinigri TaxID=472181 RepID=A0A1H1WF00_9GAMM|nr:tetratricopeptide repeat protein [Halopseudomonas sabulinigri]SDS95703.1 Tetratricopeptide repeat-containing protein [Halopseudomonas sabulinigri]